MVTMARSDVWRVAVLLLLPPALLTGCRSPVDGVRGVAAQPREEALAEFTAICEQLEASDDEYYGTAQIAELETRLAGETGAPAEGAGIRLQLGQEKLRVGDPAAAAELFRDAGKISQEAGLPPAAALVAMRGLGLASLRLGEQSNCVAMHGPASCILPIREEGLHRDRAGSEAAMRAYEAFLGVVPDQPAVQWLLNVAAMTLGRYPDGVDEAFRVPPEQLRSSLDIKHFPDIATSVGIRITQPSGGGIMDDFDGDGLLDIVSSTIDPCEPMNFYRNDGRGGFEDVSERSGLTSQLGGLNVIHADYDNDGDLDLFVLRGGWLGAEGRIRNSLLRNDGTGSFEDVTRAAGLDAPAYPTQTGGFADYDNDGDLDLYIGNEAEDEGKPYPSQLFRNEGDGTFIDVAEAAGVRNDRMAKSVAWGDYDNDGDPDLYVSNLGPNRLYRNEGDGTFIDVAARAGVVEPAGRSFPSWFFDYDNDGDLDLFVADYGASLDDVALSLLGRPNGKGLPRLYRNDGAGGFDEVGREVGLLDATLPMGSNYGDLDNDGFLDFYLGTGTPSYESIAPNLMYRNDGGTRFQNVTYSGGFGHLQKGHGVAFGDFDNDGDQDIFEQMGGAYPGDAYPSVLYENPGHGNAWVTLILEGTTSNRSALGTRIRVAVEEEGATRDIHAVVGSGGSFGGSSLQQEIGLGGAERIREIEVAWPAGGARQVFRDVEPHRTYRIREGGNALVEVSRPAL